MPSHAEIIAAAAGQAAATGRLAAIAVFTASGGAGRLISRLRPALPIFAFTPSPPVARALSISYGVHPVLVSAVESTDVMIEMVERELLEKGNLKPGDEVAVVAGQPTGIVDGTNLLKLHRLGELSH